MSAPTTINIGLCGFGTVGQGVWKHLSANRAELEARLGVKLNLARAAVRNPRKARAVKIPARKLTTDPLAIATDPKIHVVCELMGGTTLARRVTLAALRRGKIVVSANKALICAHGAEIFAVAQKHGGHFFFEASVAGGIPIIKALREGLVANRFPRIYGILNGTCNYILTQMEDRDAPYASVLADAKRLGYRAQGLLPCVARARRLGEPGRHDRRGYFAHHARRFQERGHPRLRHQAPRRDHQRYRPQRTVRAG